MPSWKTTPVRQFVQARGVGDRRRLVVMVAGAAAVFIKSAQAVDSMTSKPAPSRAESYIQIISRVSSLPSSSLPKLCAAHSGVQGFMVVSGFGSLSSFTISSAAKGCGPN
jgi:hypothetical protein